MKDQNYATVAEFQPWPQHEPGWFMLEWDIALDRQSRERFVANAMQNPDRVRVAPYTLYYEGVPARQVHRWGGRPIPDGQPHADMVGFGCIYFPQVILDRFWAEPPARLVKTGMFNDGVFSDWHGQRYDPIAVDWTVCPQHVHGD